MTTDEITDALLDLVTAIDRRDHSEAVCVPSFTPDGKLTEALMTLDAGSEVVAMPVDVDIDTDDDTRAAIAAAVEDIRSRINRNTKATEAKAINDAYDHGVDLDEF
ncbi:hypothetical protein [Marisediminicola sp. LYQ85]|uniref:hypothetical protein n=1 Tax=Marisediminicola sp. LYQ85 TaxID=3391062 RepID=UPI0039834D55